MSLSRLDPHNTHILDHKPPDLELETIGFSPPQVEEYTQITTKHISTSDKIVSELRSFIQECPLVQSLVRIPIQLDAICYVWGMEHFSKNDVTMAKLYQAISRRLWVKDVLRLGKQLDEEQITKQQLELSPDVEVFVEAETKFLQELGFQGVYNDVTEFDFADITHAQTGLLMLGDTRVHMSFLCASDNSSEVSNSIFRFVDLTFQNFFAARYFVRHWINGTPLRKSSLGGLSARTAADFLKSNISVSRYDIFWHFVVGLLQMEADNSHLERFFGLLGPEASTWVDTIGLREVN